MADIFGRITAVTATGAFTRCFAVTTGYFEKVVRRLMAEEQLVVSAPRRRRYNSYCVAKSARHRKIYSPGILVPAGQMKLADRYYGFQLPAGKKSICRRLSTALMARLWLVDRNTPDATLVNTMLDEHSIPLNEHDKPVIHSDRGGHLPVAGLGRSYQHIRTYKVHVAKGCSSDNAACEGFFGRIKTEMFYGRNWTGITLENLSASGQATYAGITRNVSSYH